MRTSKRLDDLAFRVRCLADDVARIEKRHRIEDCKHCYCRETRMRVIAGADLIFDPPGTLHCCLCKHDKYPEVTA